MQLFSITLTGADNSIDPIELVKLSEQYPIIEWAILMSEKNAGDPRFPDKKWFDELQYAAAGTHKNTFRLSAHLCGSTMRNLFKTSSDPQKQFPSSSMLEPFGLTLETFISLFGRVQLNFNGRREGFKGQDYFDLIKRWHQTMTIPLITQDHLGNRGLTELLQFYQYTFQGPTHLHQVLFDASGGRGKSPSHWPTPIAGALTGYAGGISPQNVIETLETLNQIVQRGYIWIDMESSLRDKNNRFHIEIINLMLAEIQSHPFLHEVVDRETPRFYPNLDD